LNDQGHGAGRLDGGCFPDVIAQHDCRSKRFDNVEAQSDVFGRRDGQALLYCVLPILLEADPHSFDKYGILLQDQLTELSACGCRRLFECRWVMRSTIVERNASVVGGILATGAPTA
jgi:hypothetical protein